MLINLQPYARPMHLAVRLGNELHAAGTAREIPAKIDAMGASLRAVAELVRWGQFSLRNERFWRFVQLLPSPEDWTEFLGKPTCGGFEADQELLDAALERPDGHIVLTEEDRAAVYARLLA